MSISKRYKLLQISTIGFVAALFVAVVLTSFNEAALNASHAISNRSWLLADELRQSSDDLTRLARTYVVTGDASYERQYWAFSRYATARSPDRMGAVYRCRR
jgi:methyl-accepting chemotaxis protein